MATKKEKRFEKVTEWTEFSTTKWESLFFSFILIIIFFFIGLFFGWLVVTIWWTQKRIEHYKIYNKVYWREIK